MPLPNPYLSIEAAWQKMQLMSALAWIISSSLAMSCIALVGAVTLVLKQQTLEKNYPTPGRLRRWLTDRRRIFTDDSRRH